MSFIKAGEQFWNDDHTEGYEITHDVQSGDIIMASTFKPLGLAPKPEAGEIMPEWAQFFNKPGGIELYRERNKPKG